MFSRRHPYLFSALVFSALVTLAVTTVAIVTGIVVKSEGEPDFSGEKVGVVTIEGPITDSREAIRQLKILRESDAVKAIVVRVDSPGGAVGPSQEIYREVMKTKQVKKVVASMGAVAASGGYYIAAAADRIVANPGTITGSIGVIMGFTNFRQLMEKIGLSPVVIKSGPYKDMGSPTRAMTDDEKALLQDIIDQIHQQFIQAVSKGRNLDKEKVTELADGRIFTGQQARQLGLVDTLGNFEDAVQLAGKLGGITGKVETVSAARSHFSIIDYLLGTTMQKISGYLAGQPLRFDMRY